jgi:predicted  nucleic acid-binding Zn-ribbon protein
MPEQVTLKCLRCGNEWRSLLDTDIERICPKCRSNSVRRIKDKEARGHTPADQEGAKPAGKAQN